MKMRQKCESVSQELSTGVIHRAVDIMPLDILVGQIKNISQIVTSL
jgi:hypothetical protein